MLRVVAECLQGGGIVVYPTDTAYALACHLGDKNALERIIAIRRLSKKHQFTLACRDLSELGTYARVDNAGYRLLRRVTPGPFTFVMRATREVPRRLLHVKRKTIGVRVPDNAIALALLEMVGEPLLTTTLRLPDAEQPMTDPEEIQARLNGRVDIVIDGGLASETVSTVVDLTGSQPEITREGAGDLFAEPVGQA